jgi:hypothetical protein
MKIFRKKQQIAGLFAVQFFAMITAESMYKACKLPFALATR